MLRFPNLYRISSLKFSTIKSFVDCWRARTNGDNTLWSRNLLERDKENVDHLRRIVDNINLQTGQDLLLWKPGKGEFSTRNLSDALQRISSLDTTQNSIWKIIWKSKLPQKISIFLWKIQWRVLPTKQFLNSRISTIPPFCAWRSVEVESLNHLFWECDLAIWAWNYVSNWWSVSRILASIHSFSLRSLFKIHSSDHVKRLWKLVVAATLWTIWLFRNEVTFIGKKTSKATLEHLIFTRVCE